MTEEAKKLTHRKMSEGVAQIGRLVAICAKEGLTESDIIIMLQTATSLVCEMNAIEIGEYMKFLYVLHKRRTGQATEEQLTEDIVNAELAVMFSLKDSQH